MDGADIYTHGHAEPVLRSHRSRTLDNSAAYLLPHLQDGQDVLDVGCGPATITADLARRFPASRVLGIDPAAAVLAEAQAEGLPANLTLEPLDLEASDLDGRRFDIVHAHQVLQHLADPVAALRRMAALCRPGGIVAVRDVDYQTITVVPADPALESWRAAYRAAARRNGHEPDAGRHLLGWAHAADLTDVTATASAWCFADPRARRLWGEMWADRVASADSRLNQHLRRDGADDASIEEMAAAWHRWAAHPDGWCAMVHGELIVRVAAT